MKIQNGRGVPRSLGDQIEMSCLNKKAKYELQDPAHQAEESDGLLWRIRAEMRDRLEAENALEESLLIEKSQGKILSLFSGSVSGLSELQGKLFKKRSLPVANSPNGTQHNHPEPLVLKPDRKHCDLHR